jgi:hypothetical protein
MCMGEPDPAAVVRVSWPYQDSLVIFQNQPGSSLRCDLTVVLI